MDTYILSNIIETSGSYEKEKKYWRNQLNGIPKIQNYPKYKEEDINILIDSKKGWLIPPQLVKRINHIGNDVDIAVYWILLSVSILTYSLWTGQLKYIVGTPLTTQGDKSRESKALLPLAIKLNVSVTYKEYLKALREQILEGEANQNIPQEYLWEHIKVQIKELFGKNLLSISVAASSLHSDNFLQDVGSDFFFWFDISETETRIIISSNNTGEEKRHERQLYSIFEKVLSQILFNPDVKLIEISGISAWVEEVRRRGFSVQACTIQKTIQELFEEQVLLFGDRTAIVSGEQKITFLELNSRINKLSRYLMMHGIRKGSLVGVFCDQSGYLSIIMILAVIKAGGVYLPINSRYPIERIRLILKDSCVECIISSDDLAFDFMSDIKTVNYRHVENELIGISDDNIPVQNTPEDALYVIYTSGSTGMPKGVVVEHKSLVNLIMTCREVFGFDIDDVWTQFHSLSFDFSVWEIFGALLTGGILVMVDCDTVRDTVAFRHLLIDQHVTVLNQTPTAFNCLLNMEKKEKTRKLKLKYIIFGGEKLGFHDLGEWNKLYPETKLVNMYGITETTVHSTIHFITKEELVNRDSIIGKPLPNISAYVLNEDGRLQSFGMAGELYIGGCGLARGYLNRPELTAERFIRTEYDSGLLYRSGDVVRLNSYDGELVYEERKDSQVKVNGYRIELGEIEQKLCMIEGIETSAVLCNTEKNQKKYLHAYVAGKNIPSLKLIYGELSKYLPAYMIPTKFTKLDSLPLTINGKLDRNAILQLPENMFETSQECNEAGYYENEILVTWQNVLGRSEIHVDDNFFHLGGDSIKAIQIISELKEKNIRVNFRQIFELQTVRKLAKNINYQIYEKNYDKVTGLVNSTPIQIYFLESVSEPAGLNKFCQSVVLHHRLGFDEDRVKRAWEILVNHHDMLRAQLHIECGKTKIEIPETLPYLPMDVLQLDSESEEKFEEHTYKIFCDMHTGLNIEKAMHRVCICRSKYGEYLIIVINHLIIDGISWRILLEDFFTLYEQPDQRLLSGKTDSFQKWSTSILHYAETPELKKEKTYWEKMLKQVTGIKGIKQNRNSTCASFKKIEVKFTEEDTLELTGKLPEKYNSNIKTILLSILFLALRSWNGEKKHSIIMEGHGREMIQEDLDVSRTVGWFTSLYPVLLNAECDNVDGIIKQIGNTLDKIPNNGIGFGILKYLSQTEEKLSASWENMPDICFNYLGEFDMLSSKVIGEFFSFQKEDLFWEQPLRYALEINGILVGKHLTISFGYDSDRLCPEAVEQLCKCFQDYAKKLLETTRTALVTRNFLLSDVRAEDVEELQLEYQELYGTQIRIEDVYPLTPSQVIMLMNSLLKKGDNAFYNRITYSLEGSLDIGLFIECFKTVILSRDNLRGFFHMRRFEQPVQIIVNDPPIPVHFADYTNGTEMAAVRELAEKEFVLSKEIGIRLCILKTSVSNYEVIWCFHHILMDGWSIGLLIKEIFEYYRDRYMNRQITWSNPPQFRNYLCWLLGKTDQEAFFYWKEYLSGYKVNAMMFSRKKKEEQSYLQNQITLEFTLEESVNIEKFATANTLTISSILQTVWGLVLCEVHNSKDIIFGMVTSGRTNEVQGSGKMVGLLLNLVPVRIKLEQNQSYLELMKKTQDNWIESQPFCYLPFNSITGTNHIPDYIFEHVFVYENYPRYSEENSIDIGFKVTDIDYYDRTSHVLNVIVVFQDTIKISCI